MEKMGNGEIILHSVITLSCYGEAFMYSILNVVHCTSIQKKLEYIHSFVLYSVIFLPPPWTRSKTDVRPYIHVNEH